MSHQSQWTSRFGYIMTAAGFSIGLGNIWRFPYLTGTEGGGAFVIIYVLMALLIGIPLFIMETGLGRKTKLSPVEGMRKLNGRGNIWNSLAWLGVAAAFFILTYYIQIMGWIVSYFIRMAGGLMKGQNYEETKAAFDGFRGNWPALLIFTLICMAIVAVISAAGLEKGVEKTCKVIMPLLFIMLVMLAIRSLTMPNAFEGVKWYLTPDFSKVTGKTFLNALGQIFFSIGIASGGALVYGAYLDDKSDMITDCSLVVILDTGAAILAGLVIFPAIFSMGLEPGSGPGLLFVSMSRIFSDMPFGQFFGAVFFLLVFFAALSSALGYLEPVATTVRDNFKISRPAAVWSSLIAAILVGLPAILSEGPLKNVRFLGMNLFDADDFFSGNVLMPLGAIVLIFYVIFKWKYEGLRDDVNKGARNIKVAPYWKILIYGVIPIALVIIFVTGIISVI